MTFIVMVTKIHHMVNVTQLCVLTSHAIVGEPLAELIHNYEEDAERVTEQLFALMDEQTAAVEKVMRSYSRKQNVLCVSKLKVLMKQNGPCHVIMHYLIIRWNIIFHQFKKRL